VNHRIALRLADITLEPLTQLFGELLIGDEIAKVIGKVIVEYRLEDLTVEAHLSASTKCRFGFAVPSPEPGDVKLAAFRVWASLKIAVVCGQIGRGSTFEKATSVG